MKYIANQDIDKFKKGDEVPEELAKVWIDMYKFPPVDVEKKSKSKPKEIPKEETKEESLVESVRKTLTGGKKYK